MGADLYWAIRRLVREPTYAAIVVLTLGLGIGGLTAVFTLADPMIFRPLPYADGDRVVEIRAETKENALKRLHADDFIAIVANTRTLDAVASVTAPYLVTPGDKPDPVLGYGVTSGFLRVTGLSSVLGRVFRPDEYERDYRQPPTVAMISWGFWQQALGGGTDVIGKKIEGRQGPPIEIVGVLPREFFFPEIGNEAPSFIFPGHLDPAIVGNPRVYPSVFARVRPEFTFEQVEAELQPFLADVEHANPGFEQGRRTRVERLQTLLFKGLRTPLLLLFTATCCLLLLAWVNLSHLTQAHARARARDWAVRLALGAGRWRIVRQGLAETLVLSAVGSAVGLAIGSALFAWGMARTPQFDHVYRLIPASMNGRVVLFTLAVSVIGMIAVGIWPAWRASQTDVRSTLATATDRVRGWRIGGESIAIAAQAALAVGLVVTCVLVVRSFAAIVLADRGFDPAHVQLARITVPAGEPAFVQSLYRRMVEEIGRVPGVEAAAATSGIPALTVGDAVVDVAGGLIRNVSAFRASGVLPTVLTARLDEGRLFDDAEAFSSAPVAIVDRNAAELMWPGQAALGQTVHLRDGRTCEVVGVVAAISTNFYEPAARQGVVLVTIDPPLSAGQSRLSIAIRFDPSQTASHADLSAAVKRANPGATWNGSAGLSSWERLVGQPRFLASSLGLLALLTALLAGFGVLGVVSHLVSRRTREIGVRLALGANRGRVQRLIVWQTMAPAIVGVGAGLVLAFWWSGTVRSVITGIQPHDPWSFAIAATATLGTIVVASLSPAIRASRLDPARTLRAE